VRTRGPSPGRLRGPRSCGAAWLYEVAVFLADDLRARDAAVDLVPFRAGALVVLRARPFAALRAGDLAVLRAGARVVLRVALRVVFRAALRAGALVAFLVLAFVVLAFVALRAGAFVVLRAAFVVFLAGVRPAALDFLASDLDVFEADLLAFLASPLPLRAADARVVLTRRLAACLVPVTRFSAAVAAFLIAVIGSPIAS